MTDSSQWAFTGRFCFLDGRRWLSWLLNRQDLLVAFLPLVVKPGDNSMMELYVIYCLCNSTKFVLWKTFGFV